MKRLVAWVLASALLFAAPLLGKTKMNPEARAAQKRSKARQKEAKRHSRALQKQHKRRSGR
jgi:hypothetical protein